MQALKPQSAKELCRFNSVNLLHRYNAMIITAFHHSTTHLLRPNAVGNISLLLLHYGQPAPRTTTSQPSSLRPIIPIHYGQSSLLTTANHLSSLRPVSPPHYSQSSLLTTASQPSSLRPVTPPHYGQSSLLTTANHPSSQRPIVAINSLSQNNAQTKFKGCFHSNLRSLIQVFY